MTRQQIIIALAFTILISLLLILPRTSSPRGRSTPILHEEKIMRFVVAVTGQVYDREAHILGSPPMQVNSGESLDGGTQGISPQLSINDLQTS